MGSYSLVYLHKSRKTSFFLLLQFIFFCCCCRHYQRYLSTLIMKRRTVRLNTFWVDFFFNIDLHAPPPPPPPIFPLFFFSLRLCPCRPICLFHFPLSFSLFLSIISLFPPPVFISIFNSTSSSLLPLFLSLLDSLFFYFSICDRLSTSLSIYPSICLSIYVSIYPSIYQFIYLPTFI